jgi:3-oxoacyl-[acyl-carrier protein] reductase
MRRYFLTGASRGIGRATALALAGPDTVITLAGRSVNALDEVALEVAQRGGQALVALMDLRDLVEVERAANAAMELMGGVDVLINNGGIFNTRKLDVTDAVFFEDMLRVNLTAPLVLTQTLLPGLRASAAGVIINILSIAAETAYPENSAYSASKFGLRGLSDAWREELKPDGIRVCSIYPKGTNTTIFDDVPGDWDRSTMDAPEAVAELIVRATQAGAPDELRMY